MAQIGGRRIAAPPAGANNGPNIALPAIVERYRALLEIGDQAGVVPELEFWGPSTTLNRLSQETGGMAYFQGTTGFVTFDSYFDRLRRTLNEQYGRAS